MKVCASVCVVSLTVVEAADLHAVWRSLGLRIHWHHAVSESDIEGGGKEGVGMERERERERERLTSECVSE